MGAATTVKQVSGGYLTRAPPNKNTPMRCRYIKRTPGDFSTLMFVRTKCMCSFTSFGTSSSSKIPKTSEINVATVDHDGAVHSFGSAQHGIMESNTGPMTDDSQNMPTRGYQTTRVRITPCSAYLRSSLGKPYITNAQRNP